MARLPSWGHRPAGALRNTGSPPRQVASPPMHVYDEPVHIPISDAVGQQLVAADGTAVVILGPQAVGTRWYPSQLQVNTTTGNTDTATCTIYRNIVSPIYQVGQTIQGGNDTLGTVAPMQTGEYLIAVWENCSRAGDLATFTIYGDQVVLT